MLLYSDCGTIERDCELVLYGQHCLVSTTAGSAGPLPGGTQGLAAVGAWADYCKAGQCCARPAVPQHPLPLAPLSEASIRLWLSGSGGWRSAGPGQNSQIGWTGSWALELCFLATAQPTGCAVSWPQHSQI